MWVKICANTNLDDALLAAELGADAVGFVFAPSLRQVTPAVVANITPHLPPRIDRVGVFPAWSAAQIVAAVHEAGLSAVQLHGGLDLDLASSLREALGPDLPILQAVHWHVGQDESPATDVRAQLQQIAATSAITRALVDSKVGASTGGTGTPFPWEAARHVFEAHSGLVLAGGLCPENVRDAVEQLRPWGVDVASGVEAKAGKKDKSKMAAFLAEAKRPLSP